MSDIVEEYKNKHIENYKMAISEIIKNSTNMLFDEDVMSLIKKPPLDSMDLIKSKMLSLAKKYDIIIKADILENKLEIYRNTLIKECDSLKKLRSDTLIAIVEKWYPDKDIDIFKLTKSDFVSINKKIKSDFKKLIVEVADKKLLDNLEELFNENVGEDIVKKLTDEFSKYVIKSYPKQLIESLEIKIMVKDTTLINIIREQGERYLFTLNNSRILNDQNL